MWELKGSIFNLIRRVSLKGKARFSWSPDQHSTNIHFVVQCHLVVYGPLGRLKNRAVDLCFFLESKHPLVNRETLALPLTDGGFNIPLLQTRIYSFRLNTLNRLLSGGGETPNAQWKYFTAFSLGVSNMKLGKMTLVLDYSPQRTNHDIPAFHRELLMAWHRYKECHTRTQITESVTDVLNEPLFLNDLITSQEKSLLYTDWIAAGIARGKEHLSRSSPRVFTGSCPLRDINW